MRNVALIELSESHGECLYSQALFLENSVKEIHLICHEKLADQTSFKVNNYHRNLISYQNKFLSRFQTHLGIRKYLKSNKIDTIIFNTTTGRIIQELLLFIPKNIKCYGSIHDGRKLVKSTTQKSISKRMSGYYVLNDYVKDYLIEKKASSPPISVYYPIFFPQMELESISKSENNFWIVIPGVLEQKRRNYYSIIDNLVHSPLPHNIKFILLGSSKHFNGDGIEFEKRIVKHNLQKNFIYFDSFISNKEYFAYIKNADLIMPAIEPGNEFYNTYKYSQITGSYNLSFGFGIPLLYHEDLSLISDLRDFGISYNTNNFSEIIKDLVAERKILQNIRDKIISHPKFSLQFQRENYLKHLSL
ncbi:MAG: hypothetical protein KKA84_10460 [Bacteroidetes bacterium]|nr:hypothetical protein [Bacteroidota bacterium]